MIAVGNPLAGPFFLIVGASLGSSQEQDATRTPQHFKGIIHNITGTTSHITGIGFRGESGIQEWLREIPGDSPAADHQPRVGGARGILALGFVLQGRRKPAWANGGTAQEFVIVIRIALNGQGNRDSGTLSGYNNTVHPVLGRRLSRKRPHFALGCIPEAFQAYEPSFVVEPKN